MIFAYVLFFSFVFVFLLTVLVTLGGLIGKLTMPGWALKALVPALLVETAAAVVLQFKTLDLTTKPQQLEAEILAVQIPLKTPGEKVTAEEKLHRLVQVYQNNSTAESDLAVCTAQLRKATKPLEIVGKFHGVDDPNLVSATVKPAAYQAVPLYVTSGGEIKKVMGDVEVKEFELTVIANGYKPQPYTDILDIDTAVEENGRRRLDVPDRVNFTKIRNVPSNVATVTSPPAPAKIDPTPPDLKLESFRPEKPGSTPAPSESISPVVSARSSPTP
jgi:hypothetical protein